ncbi:hypothetical protein MUP32_03960 [Candidatus Microgenomates bacterium]|nr:hypothetical protein [Candidatus Microgenomates bacterium]
MKKVFAKMPLYLGLSVFVISVLVSVVTVSNKNVVTNQLTQATVKSAKLSLVYNSPDLISVIVNSEKEIAGADVVLKFDREKIEIIPSSLIPGQDFSSTGGLIDENSGNFIFSVLSSGDSVMSGVMATFKIKPKEGVAGIETNISFETADEQTAVISKLENENILFQADSLQFTLPAN